MDTGVKAALGIGVVLLLAVLIPVLTGPLTGDVSDTYRIEANGTHDLTKTLTAEAVAVNTTGDNATLLVRNTRTFETNQTLLNVSETATVNLSGDSVTIGLQSITSAGVATVNTSYPAMLGWNGPARAVFENLHVLIIAIAFVLFIGMVVMLL